MKRQALLKQLTEMINRVKLDHPIRVAIDGVDAAGKTNLADEFAKELKIYDRQVIRASIDGFHNPKEIRYSKGRNSPAGYYLDSFNNQAIIQNLLAPLGPGGNRLFKKTTFDFRSDKAITTPVELADNAAVLIMDGVFLLRPVLVDCWDFKIFLDVDFDITLQRAIERDSFMGSEAEIVSKYNERYIPGQKLYLKEAKPKQKADIVIDNNDLLNPRFWWAFQMLNNY